MGRSWSCTQNQCPKRCSVHGDSHYTTFDNKRYQFHGACDYTLVQDECGNASGTFRIQAENIPCGSTGVTCTKSITITLNDTQITMVRGSQPTVKSVPGSSQTVQKPDFRLEKSGLFEILRTRIGVTIVWDFGTRIYITLDTSFRGLSNDLKILARVEVYKPILSAKYCDEWGKLTSVCLSVGWCAKKFIVFCFALHFHGILCHSSVIIKL